jgi:8-oxo-dGTP diphosphatase
MSEAQPIRLNVNAAIVRDDELLLVEFRDENGVHFNLPGGGLDSGESVEEGLKRECREEASVEVTVERLLLVWEYVPQKENFKYGSRQKVGLVFLCRLKENSTPKLPERPDKNQTGVRWIKLSELTSVPTPPRPPIFPTIERPLLEAINAAGGPTRVWSEGKVEQQ